MKLGKVLILIFAFIGISFSLYLFFNRPNLTFCSLGSCNSVLISKFSKTLGVDNSILGVFYFLIVGILAYLNKEKFLKILSVPSALFALYLIFVMLFILKEICYYCLIVDLSAIIIFVLSYDFRKYFQKIFGSFFRKNQTET
jgi:uncharacterized membrane protein